MLSIRCCLTRTIGRSILSTRMTSSGPIKTDLDDFMNENDHADNQEFDNPRQNQQQFDVGQQEDQQSRPRRMNKGYFFTKI